MPSLSVIKESDIQIQVAAWLRLYEPSYDFVFFAVPNEGMGKAKTGAGLGRMARLKCMGLRKGVSDIVIIKNGKAYFLEIKRSNGKLTDAQAEFGMLIMRHAKAQYKVAFSFEQAQEIIRNWGIVS